MKLIYVQGIDGNEHYINPIHVEEVKVVRSDYNQNWCIVLTCKSNIHTILCNSDKMVNEKLAEVKEAMESI